MTSEAREFIDFWIKNCVHASEQYGPRGGAQTARVLAGRCTDMAKSQNITLADMETEVGDLADYIRTKMLSAETAEDARTDRHRNLG